MRRVLFPEVDKPATLFVKQRSPDGYDVWLPHTIAKGAIDAPDETALGLMFEGATTADLVSLSQLDAVPIEYVSFDTCSLSPNNMHLVWCLRDLHQIDFYDCVVQEGTLAGAAGARFLRVVHLAQCQLDGDVFHGADEMPHVQVFSLIDTTLPTARLRFVSRLTNLRELSLSGTDTSDDDLENLSHLATLETLWLNETQITDQGVIYLQELSQLKHLYLLQTAVTSTGVNQLTRSLPECEIEYGNESVDPEV